MQCYAKVLELFRSAKVYHTTTVLAKDRVDELVRALHAAGICQIKKSDAGLDSAHGFPAVTEVDEIQLRLSKSLGVLEEYAPRPAPESILKNLFFPCEPETFSVELLSTNKVIKQTAEYLGMIEPTLGQLSSSLAETKKKIENNDYLISNLELLPQEEEMDLFASTENISIMLGVIAAKTFPKIEHTLLKETVFLTNELENNELFIAVAVYAGKAAEIERLLHEHGLRQIKLPLENRKPMAVANRIREENHALRGQEAETKKRFRELWDEHGRILESLNESLDICKERIAAAKQMAMSQSFSILEAWVPAKDIKKFNETVESVAAGQYYIEAGEREDAPTVFDNPKIFRPFEMITELYSAPKYNEFDPTPVLAFSFCLFFGFMLSDVAYGAIMLAVAYALNRGIGRINPGIKKFTSLLMLLGAATMVLGVVFGSYFGDILPRLGLQLPMLLDTMKDAVVIIGIAICIGALHLLAGLIIGYKENVRKKNLMKAVSDQGVWILFLVGAAMALIGQGIISTAGILMVILSVILQLAAKFIESGPIISVISLASFSALMGDIFSYARLTALAVGTAGIALAINFMALMAAGMIPVAGIFVGALIFFVGHIFNMLMNSLGGFIHSLRLHFLEFFSKFYDGGGHVYRPFYAYRKTKPMEVE